VKGTRVDPVSLAPGDELAPLRKHLAEAQVIAFEDCSAALMDRPVMRNIHNDPEQARAVGLQRPIASGMISVSFLNELLRDAFGEAWYSGGHLSVAFVSPLYAGDEAIARARVIGSENGRLTLDVWTENGSGTKLAVGKADLSV
jgi:acyl dehydratase